MLAHFVPLERLHVQEPQSRDTGFHTAWRELLLAEQIYLVLAKLCRPEFVGRLAVVVGELLDRPQVVPDRTI